MLLNLFIIKFVIPSYKGQFEKRNVAVKRVLMQIRSNLVEREVNSLIQIDAHPNVVSYFGSEEDEPKNFSFIAMELCQANLEQYLQNEGGIKDKFKIPAKTIMNQVTSGLHYLHSSGISGGIVHRDIKPQNVLISYPDNLGKVCAKIADFGLSKNCKGKDSFSVTSPAGGTNGWMAPEVLQGNRAVCVFECLIITFILISQISNFRRRQLTYFQWACFSIMF